MSEDGLRYPDDGPYTLVVFEREGKIVCDVLGAHETDVGDTWLVALTHNYKLLKEMAKDVNERLKKGEKLIVEESGNPVLFAVRPISTDAAFHVKHDDTPVKTIPTETDDEIHCPSDYVYLNSRTGETIPEPMVDPDDAIYAEMLRRYGEPPESEERCAECPYGPVNSERCERLDQCPDSVA